MGFSLTNYSVELSHLKLLKGSFGSDSFDSGFDSLTLKVNPHPVTKTVDNVMSTH
jgi:hypothetical protein